MKDVIVIPTYNESTRVSEIISQVKKSQYVKEIIVVNDGSTDNSRRLLAKISGITLINHVKNLGKAAALKTGLENTHREFIAFVDADLTGFKTYHLNKLANKFFEGNNDLVLGHRTHDVIWMDWIGFNLAYTGERVIKKRILHLHPEIFSQPKYLIEPAMNTVFFAKYNVASVSLNGVGQVNKIWKKGLSGLMEDIKMIVSYPQFLGLINFINQLKFAKQLAEHES